MLSRFDKVSFRRLTASAQSRFTQVGRACLHITSNPIIDRSRLFFVRWHLPHIRHLYIAPSLRALMVPSPCRSPLPLYRTSNHSLLPCLLMVLPRVVRPFLVLLAPSYQVSFPSSKIQRRKENKLGARAQDQGRNGPGCSLGKAKKLNTMDLTLWTEMAKVVVLLLLVLFDLTCTSE